MSELNRANGPRKLRVTVTVEELEPFRSIETLDSKEPRSGVGAFLDWFGGFATPLLQAILSYFSRG